MPFNQLSYTATQSQLLLLPPTTLRPPPPQLRQANRVLRVSDVSFYRPCAAWHSLYILRLERRRRVDREDAAQVPSGEATADWLYITECLFIWCHFILLILHSIYLSYCLSIYLRSITHYNIYYKEKKCTYVGLACEHAMHLLHRLVNKPYILGSHRHYRCYR